MCFVLGFSPSWKVPVRSGGAEPTAHSCGPPHERSQLPGDYRAPGAWGGGRSTRAVALSSLPCLTPPFMSASLATLSFPPLPLLSLHLASFPCLPPSPSHRTWLCWLPLHPSCHPSSRTLRFHPPTPSRLLPPPLRWRPAPTPALPLCHLLPQPKTSHCHGAKARGGTNFPQVFSVHVQKAFPPFFHPSWCPHQAASKVTPLPGCTPALSQPGILLPPPSASWKQRARDAGGPRCPSLLLPPTFLFFSSS